MRREMKWRVVLAKIRVDEIEASNFNDAQRIAESRKNDNEEIIQLRLVRY